MQIVFGERLYNEKSTRSSTVPYVVTNNKIYYLFGIYKGKGDNKQGAGDITDLGGGAKKGEVDIITALRELNEESKEIFKDVIKLSDLVKCVSVIDKKAHTSTSCIFIPVNEEWLQKTSTAFSNSITLTCDSDELSGLIWLSEDELQHLLHDKNSKMWHKIQYFYINAFSSKLNLREALLARWWWSSP